MTSRNLKGLLALKYGSTHDAASSLGNVKEIRQNVVGFQSGLFRPRRLENNLRVIPFFRKLNKLTASAKSICRQNRTAG